MKRLSRFAHYFIKGSALDMEPGFTLVELLLAMSIFSFMLLIVTAGFINVVKINEEGIASRSTQQNVRLLMDQVTKDIRQSAAATVAGVAPTQRLCLAKGSQTVEYAVDATIPTAAKLRKNTIANPAAGTCPVPAFNATWTTINDPTVAITQFRLATTPPVSPGLGTVMVTVTAVSVDNLNVLNAAKTACLPGSGAQFCAVTTVSSGATLSGGNGL